MSSLRDRLDAIKERETEAEPAVEEDGIWTPNPDANIKEYAQQHNAAKVAVTMGPFWSFATGSGGAKVRLYAPTVMLVCFTIMVAIGAAR